MADQIQVVTPEICAPVFTPNAIDTVSNRYQHLSTINIVDVCRDGGWEVVSTAAQRVRNEARQGFQKHFVNMRFGRATLQVGDCEMRMMLVNSHDGLSSVSLFAGLFRKVCMNGLHVDAGMFAAIRIRHTNTALQESVLLGANKIAALAPAMDEQIKKMQEFELTPEQQRLFAQDAIKVIWPNKDSTYVKAENLLQARRPLDGGNSLWTTYNTVQENATKGGISTLSDNGRSRSSRRIVSPSRDLSVNTGLFGLAVQVMEKANG